MILQITDDKIGMIAHFLYNFRKEQNLLGDEQEDWKLATQILISLQTEDKLRGL